MNSGREDHCQTDSLLGAGETQAPCAWRKGCYAAAQSDLERTV